MSYKNKQRDDESPGKLPASVIFTEMMRQAAARQQPAATAPSSLPPTNESAAVATDQETPLAELADARHTAAIEAQRVQRVQRRKARKRRQTVGILAGMFRAFLVAIISGGLIATILSWWTSPDSLPRSIQAELGQLNPTSLPAQIATAIPTPNYLRRIGIISGHSGPENDPGSDCKENGVTTLRESDLNMAVASRVREALLARGYNVDLLEEWDARLNGYQADALVAVHSNDCSDYGELVSGYLIAQAEARPAVDSPDALLVDCIAAHYSAMTPLQRRYNLTIDMTDYHAFRQISITTPGAIIEIGFMLGDREFISGQPDIIAQAIVDGILCFLDGGDDPLLYPTPTPSLFETTTPTATP